MGLIPARLLAAALGWGNVAASDSDLRFPGALGFALTTLFHASSWLIRRPFIASPVTWLVVVGLAAGFAIVELVLGNLLPAGVALLIALLAAATFGHWLHLTRGEGPVVVVSLFKGESASGRAAAESHLASLVRFLEADQSIAKLGPVQIRRVPVVVSTRSAQRLLSLQKIVLVVRGVGDATPEFSEWRAEVHCGPSVANIELGQFEGSTRSAEIKTPWWRRLGSAALHGERATIAEGDLSLRQFVAETVEVEHFRDIARILLVLLCERAIAFPVPGAEITLIGPANDDPSLSPGLAGRVLKLDAFARNRTPDSRSVLEDIERLSFDRQLGDEALAMWAVGQWFVGVQERWATIAEAAEASERWAGRFESSGVVAANHAAIVLMAGDVERAKRIVSRAIELGASRDVTERLRGNLAWQEKRVHDALRHYRRVGGRFGGALRWQIGDCHAYLGRRRRAMFAYRQALRADPFCVPAAEQARQVARLSPIQATFPPGWRSWIWEMLHSRPRLASSLLRLWRFARPEDPYIAACIARHALVIGDFRRADHWGAHATRFGGTSRLVAQLDFAVVLAFIGYQDTDGFAAFAREHMDWLVDQGVPEIENDAVAALDLLVKSLPRSTPHGDIRAALAPLANVGIRPSASF